MVYEGQIYRNFQGIVLHALVKFLKAVKLSKSIDPAKKLQVKKKQKVKN